MEIEVKSVEGCGEQKAKCVKLLAADESRKHVLLIAAAILAARKLEAAWQQRQIRRQSAAVKKPRR